MKRILFIDTVCPEPYSLATLHSQPMGGTEATVVRVAEALSEHASVKVMQHNRSASALFTSGTAYGPLEDKELDAANLGGIVVLRSPHILPFLRRRKPDVPLFLWAHDLAGTWLYDQIKCVLDTGATIIAVSEFHKTNIIEGLKSRNLEVPPIKVIYNCIDDALRPITSDYDPYKLVFFSSPHKGMAYALTAFQMLRRQEPRFKLYASNPGYLPDCNTSTQENVVNLGRLSHSEILDHVGNSLCVFYPNWTFPETFGLVMAEANAVGTPVVTHPIGAAREVLGDTGQLLDCRKVVDLIDKVVSWHLGDRPKVSGRGEFRTHEVVKKWIEVLQCR